MAHPRRTRDSGWRPVLGIVVLVWATSMVVLIAYNVFIERLPDFSVPPFGAAWVCALYYVGLRWIRGQVA